MDGSKLAIRRVRFSASTWMFVVVSTCPGLPPIYPYVLRSLLIVPLKQVADFQASYSFVVLSSWIIPVSRVVLLDALHTILGIHLKHF